MTKLCPKCNKEKSLDEFNNHTINGKQGRCRECFRSAKRLYRYGITQEQYDALLIKQELKCACCLESFESLVRGRKRYPVVDHNHITGVIRGLLCDRCNWNIGSFEADKGPELIERVYKYIKTHSNS